MNISKPFKWNEAYSAFLFLFVVKIIVLFWFVSYQNPAIENCWISIPVDDEGYLTVVENLISNGVWYYDNLEMEAPRVPGQSLTYGFFRLFFSLAYAVNALLIFQVFIYCISIVFLGKILKDLTKNRFAFWICILLFTFDLYNSVWNNYATLAESLGNSFVIIGLCFFYRYLKSKSLISILLAGVFVSLSFFYKVVNIVIIFCAGIYLLNFIFRQKQSIKNSIKVIFLFSVPFIVFESIWISRNALATSEFIPIQQIKGAPIELDDNITFDLSSPARSCVNFLKSFGGNWIRWNPNSERAWFNNADYNNKMGFIVNQDINKVFPNWIYTEYLTSDLLIDARKDWHKSLDLSLSNNIRKEHAKEASLVFIAFKNNIIKNHVYRYQFTSRLNYFKNLFIHSGTYYVPFSFKGSPLLVKFTKILLMILYYVILILGSIGLINSLFKTKEKPFLFLFTSIFIGYTVLYCIVFRTNELRYNSTMYICLMIFSVDVLNILIQRKKVKQKVLIIKSLFSKS